MLIGGQNVLNYVQKSRLHHRYAEVVQDLATQWNQSYPCNTGSLIKFITSRRKTKTHLYGQFFGIYQSFRRAELESWEMNAAQIRNRRNCRTTSERRNFVSIGSLWTARKLAGRSHEVVLPSPKCASFTGRWPVTL